MLTIDDGRILWLGDSITQDGQYVSYVEYLWLIAHPDRMLDVISVGLASETLSGLTENNHPFPRPCLLERLDRAIRKINPRTIVACYGMNDGIYHPPSAQRMHCFQSGVRALAESSKAAGARLILLTPPPFDVSVFSTRARDASAPDFDRFSPYEKYDEVLAGFARWEMTLSHQDDVYVVDLHSSLNQLLIATRKTHPHFLFSSDGIHPSKSGHLMMAAIMMKALGVEYEPLDFERAASELETDPLYLLVHQRRTLLSETWLDCVGYTREHRVENEDIAPKLQEAAALKVRIDQLCSTVAVGRSSIDSLR